MTRNRSREYASVLLAKGVAHQLRADIPNCSVMVLNPHQGLCFDESDRRCLRALSGMQSLAVVRADPVTLRCDDGIAEFHYSLLLGDKREFILNHLTQRTFRGERLRVGPFLRLLCASSGLSADRADVLYDAEIFGGATASDPYLDSLVEKLVLTKPVTAVDLYYLLTRLSTVEAALSHRINARLGDPLTSTSDLGRIVRTANLVESAGALRSAIRARWGRTRSRVSDPTVLFVDDNLPPALRHTLRLAARLLWDKPRLLLWNPLHSAFGLREMIHLGAVGSIATVHDQQIVLEDFTEETTAPTLSHQKLGDLLAVATHLIVDQFFESGGDVHGLRGPELIRFFGRVVPSVSRNGTLHRPGIVAFSRDQEPDLISLAIRAGAEGYVLKSAPLRLTEYLLREPAPVQSLVGLSRNFESLEHLPPRIKDLVRTIVIPKIPVRDKEWYRSPRYAEDAGVQDVAGLLRAIPKAELHVHVGSCMSREFLVAASMIGLALRDRTWRIVEPLARFFEAITTPEVSASVECTVPGLGSIVLVCAGGLQKAGWMSRLAFALRAKIVGELYSTDEHVDELRSFLRSELKIADYISPTDVEARLQNLSSLSLVLAVLLTATKWSC